jgi:sulfur-oxidizing protein SoxX
MGALMQRAGRQALRGLAFHQGRFSDLASTLIGQYSDALILLGERNLRSIHARFGAILLPAILCASCTLSPIFGYPVEQGDVDAGRQAFIDHQCHQCHSVAGVQLPPLAGASDVVLELGGETSSVRSYAGLMTSIINPNHEISEDYRARLARDARLPLASPMPMPHIDNMTVRQLIDLVAFLDSRYILVEDYAR